MLVGAALAFGGVQLWRGGAEAWPDVIAGETTVKRAGGGMIALAALMAAASLAVLGRATWGSQAAATFTIVVVVAAFWVNHALFGDIRLAHTGTNVLVAAIILALLWFGHDGKSH